MAESGSQGLGDLFSLLGGPITSISKNIDNFRKGVEGFLVAVQTFNRTMESLDAVAQRVTKLMDDFEEPIRVLLPQVTKATKTSLGLLDQLSGPLDRVVPGLDRLADTLMSPTLTGLPNVLGDFLETMGDVAKRMSPLSQLAEAAGTMFGVRGIGGMRLPGTLAPVPAPPTRSAATPVPAKKAPAKKAPAKKAPAKKR